MSRRNWKLFILDMLNCIEKIENYTLDLSYEDFIKDEKTKDAVIRNLEVLGEAANQVPKNIRESYKDIPWQQIISIRNRSLHGYFIIDYDIVWGIVNEELYNLKIKIKKS